MKLWPIKERRPLVTGGVPEVEAINLGKLIDPDNDQKIGALQAAVSRRGGRRSRDKGARGERALVRYLQDHGFAAERVPLSGAAGGSYVGDITVPIIDVDRVVEVKCRANGFRELYKWLDGRDLLIVRADRREPLVILPLRLAVEIAAAAERGKAAMP